MVDYQRTTRCYIPEDLIILRERRCENLKSYTRNMVLVTYIRVNMVNNTSAPTEVGVTLFSRRGHKFVGSGFSFTHKRTWP
jgi:hypothetical protein